MPLHDVGYRAWSGERRWRVLRWLVIAWTGIQLVWRGTWLRRTFMLSFIPMLFMGGGFFIYEQSTTDRGAQRAVAEILSRNISIPHVVEAFAEDPVKARYQVWASLLLTYVRNLQAFMALIIIGIIAPKLISYDLRSRGFLLYFSRPVSTLEYILGKSAVIWSFLVLSITIPALCLYVIGVLISSELNVLWITWDLPLRILAASIVLIVPTTAVALALSSLTSESRYAAFSWFAFWIVGWVSFMVLTSDAAHRQVRRGPFRGRRFEITVEDLELLDRWTFVSPYHVLGKVQQWVFGLHNSESAIWPFVVAVIAVTVASFAIMYYRISAQQKI